MADPYLAVAGAGASVLGGILSRQDALDNAQRIADARNTVLRQNIAKQEDFAKTNRGTLDTNMLRYDPAAHAAALEEAQGKRAAGNVGNITDVDPGMISGAGDASGAVGKDLAKRLLGFHDQSVGRAKALGTLGGYSDQQMQDQLGNAQAGRDIGVTNIYSQGRKALLGPEQDMAEAAAYRPPSIWGQLLSGAGSVASSAAGAGGFMGNGTGRTASPAPAAAGYDFTYGGTTGGVQNALSGGIGSR